MIDRKLPCLAIVTVLSLVVSAISSADSPAGKKKGDSPMWGGSPDRNMVSDETGIPATWDVKKKTNIKWVTKLGSQT